MANHSDSERLEPEASIRDEILEQGPVTFARFMELCLYHPVHGYYTRGGGRIGRDGDFFTVSDVGTYFGACIARQLQEMDDVLGNPEPFRLLEFGGGRGLLAKDILDTIGAGEESFRGRMRYTLVDRSAGMREMAAGEVHTVSAEELPAEPAGSGCVVAVELFDALPVHRVVRRDGSLREIRVGLDRGGELASVEVEPTEEVAAYAGRYDVASGEGQEAEVCLAAEAQFNRMASTLESGFMILVDYGHPAAQLYDASRPRGTLLAYHRHKTNEEYYSRVGDQDLTAHVNWSGLTDHAAAAGWRRLALTTQDRFLVANGILELFEARDEADWQDPESVKRRLKAMQLIHPEGMGRMFQVLVLYRGSGDLPRLGGLEDPYRR
ncbi:MAG: SAM-dependent methyltransferase [Acidobacteria bacterium]|uniref:SAM-dependent methyltransferase n=1 Tax=Candidatus Polarisedimenticola svalbardensis TaxID=2886004 RepID=A0A8J7C1W3_9BACT|nr:SAM-dependent methyltransferase [Candidatus Polarisedimenticola svalbardensis]